MKTIYMSLSIGLAGANQSDILEVEDDCPAEEIQELFKDWVDNLVDAQWSYEKPAGTWW